MTFDPARVRADIVRLRAADVGLRVFGAVGHRYLLRPVLSTSELAAAEAFFGVTFPEEYRTFVRHVGNGGAGPFHGVFPLVRAGSSWRWEGDGGDLVADVAAPFPHVEPWNLEAHPLWEPPDEFDYADEAEAEAAYFAWDEKFAPVYWAPEQTNGAVPICDVGCALRKWLVVTGPAAGQMWADDRADRKGLRPLLDAAGRRHTFGSWYTDWLSQSLASVGQ